MYTKIYQLDGVGVKEGGGGWGSGEGGGDPSKGGLGREGVIQARED